MDASTLGYAAGSATNATTPGTLDTVSACVEVYNGLLLTGAASAGNGVTIDIGKWANDAASANADQGSLDAAVAAGVDFLAGRNAEICTYHYVADSARTTLNGEPRIFYNSDTGNWGIYIP